jgi:Na+-driven multidrug efflux pump
VLIRQINKSNNITQTQHKLAQLQTSTMHITRILFLQSPFYTTWFLSVDMLAGTSAGLLIFQCCITIFFTLLAIWLYRNIKYENADKKWFKILFSGKEWTSVTAAIAFMQEIEDFKNDK